MKMSSGMARTPLKKETEKIGTAWFRRCDQNNACGREDKLN